MMGPGRVRVGSGSGPGRVGSGSGPGRVWVGSEPLSRVGYWAMGAPALGDPAELAAERTSQANYGAGLSPVVAGEEL